MILKLYIQFLLQKADAWGDPLTDQFAKEGVDKKVTFTCRFTRAITGQAAWSFKQDVSLKHCVSTFIFMVRHKTLLCLYFLICF